ncbi:MAG: hypothetical protein FJ405_12710, partial [Verrucomicrobia bacterium]|nr:hypothetical protein [Verrucomicrobiota bacterium]
MEEGQVWGHGAPILLGYSNHPVRPAGPVALRSYFVDVPLGASGDISSSDPGLPGRTYRWWKSGQTIPEASGPKLSLNGAQLTDTGFHVLEVCEGNECYQAPAARVRVHPDPQILSELESHCVVIGSTIRFKASVPYYPGLEYQWFLNGQPLPGADRAALIVEKTQLTDAGNYTLRVSNPFGFKESSATLRFMADVQRGAASKITSPRYPMGRAMLSAMDAGGGMYVLGSGFAPDSGRPDYVLRKFSSAGVLLWEAVIQTSRTPQDPPYPVGLKLDLEGNVYTAWNRPPTPSVDPVLLKYRSDGQLLWKKVDARMGAGQVADLVLDSEGRAYLCGSVSGSMAVWKFEKDGAPGWTTRYLSSGMVLGLARSLVITPDGGVAVTGYDSPSPYPGFGNPHQSVLLKLDSTGAQEWVKLESSNPWEAKQGRAIGVTSSGALWQVVSIDSNATPAQLRLQEFLPDGTLQRVVKLPGVALSLWGDPGLDAASKPVWLRVDSDGSAWLQVSELAEYLPGAGVMLANLTIRKFQPNGQEQWKVSLPRAGSAVDFQSPPVVDAQGNLFAAYTQYTWTGQEILSSIRVLRSDSSGQEIWSVTPAETLGNAWSPVGLHMNSSSALWLVANSEGHWVLQQFLQQGLSGLESVVIQGPAQAQTGSTVFLKSHPLPDGQIRHQWLYEGRPIPGATAHALELSGLQISQSGRYSVLMDNGVWCRRSASHRLVVFSPLRFRYAAFRGRPGDPNRMLELALEGATLVPFVLETSSDLSSWLPIHTNANVNGWNLYNLPLNPFVEGEFFRL